MSTQRVKTIKQFFPIESYSYDSVTSMASIVANTSYTNLLFANVVVYLNSTTQYSNYKTSVNTISGNTFTAFVPYNQYLQSLSHFSVDGYLPGQTGNQTELTLPRGTGCDTVIQSYVTGTGGASYKIDVSLDAAHWINLTSMSHNTTNGNTVYTLVSPGWAYMRANLTSVGANTNLVVMSSE